MTPNPFMNPNAAKTRAVIEDARTKGFTGDDPLYAYLWLIELERLEKEHGLAYIIDDLKAKCVARGISIPKW